MQIYKEQNLKKKEAKNAFFFFKFDIYVKKIEDYFWEKVGKTELPV